MNSVRPNILSLKYQRFTLVAKILRLEYLSLWQKLIFLQQKLGFGKKREKRVSMSIFIKSNNIFKEKV